MSYDFQNKILAVYKFNELWFKIMTSRPTRHSLTDDQLEVMLEKAATKGAQKALAAFGVYEEKDHQDLSHDWIEIKNLLTQWRSVKANTFKSIFNGMGKVVTYLILLGIATIVGFKSGILK